MPPSALRTVFGTLSNGFGQYAGSVNRNLVWNYTYAFKRNTHKNTNIKVRMHAFTPYIVSDRDYFKKSLELHRIQNFRFAKKSMIMNKLKSLQLVSN